MNIELRGNVLKMALIIEDEINNLVLLYLGIDKESRKAIGHKSGTLTFKNLLDLLYDIDVLDKKEYDAMLFLMEFRNQFMHNRNCDSFEKAVDLLGQDRGKRLLKFNRWEGEILEDKYSNSFFCMSEDCVAIIQKKIERKREDVNKRHMFIRRMHDRIHDFFDLGKKGIDDILDEIKKSEMDSKTMPQEGHSVIPDISGRLIQLQNEFREKLTDYAHEIARDSYAKMYLNLVKGR